MPSLSALPLRPFRRDISFCKARPLLWLVLGTLTGITATSAAELLPLPPRPIDARGGKTIALAVADLDLAAREAVLQKEILSGNVPEFLRHPASVEIKEGPDTVIFLTMPDYLAVGSTEDSFRTPLTPGTAKAIAEQLNCTLPTSKMVDAIYRTAALKLMPTPRQPGPDMISVTAFLDYQETVRRQREAALGEHPWGTLTAGHQKDIVITPRLAEGAGKVAIYGWHRPDGIPIQPLYTGHAETWVDYSHGVRLVWRAATLNGQPSTVSRIWADPKNSSLLSDEPFPVPEVPSVNLKSEAERAAAFGEILTTLEPEPGVRIVVNRPASPHSARPFQLIVYALPNGNTIEQTMGHLPATGEDRRFNIQHIAAQTRWLRKQQPELTQIIAYLECAEKSWPAWGRKYADSEARIASIMEKLRQHVASPTARLVLTGHSGGGSFIFRYLNSRETIPDDVERIAFLDSNYAYEAAKGHDAKLKTWLQGGPDRFLTVIAYHDSIALLNGKTFVSEAGGTWGRSHTMLEDLGKSFSFTRANSI